MDGVEDVRVCSGATIGFNSRFSFNVDRRSCLSTFNIFTPPGTANPPSPSTTTTTASPSLATLLSWPVLCDCLWVVWVLGWLDVREGRGGGGEGGKRGGEGEVDG